MDAGFSSINLNWQHRHSYVDIMQKTCEHALMAGHLCIPLMRQDVANIKQASAIEVNEICNMSSALGRYDSILVHIPKALINHAGLFDSLLRVRFVSRSKRGIITNTLSSKCLPTRIQAAYVRYIYGYQAVCTRQCLDPCTRKDLLSRQHRDESRNIAFQLLGSV